MEAQVNMTYRIMDGLHRAIVATIQRAPNSTELIHRKVPASWRIYKRTRSS